MSADAFLAPWSDLLRIVVVGALAYAGLVAFLRVTGKRTLTKLNAFDLVVTVALGSTLATILLSRDVALAEGLVAFATLILLQWLVTFASVRSRGFHRAVKATPRLLVHRGTVLQEALVAERVSRAELLAAARASGASDIDRVDAMVLEKTTAIVDAWAEADGATRDRVRSLLSRPQLTAWERNLELLGRNIDGQSAKARDGGTTRTRARDERAEVRAILREDPATAALLDAVHDATSPAEERAAYERFAMAKGVPLEGLYDGEPPWEATTAQSYAAAISRRKVQARSRMRWRRARAVEASLASELRAAGPDRGRQLRAYERAEVALRRIGVDPARTDVGRQAARLRSRG